MIAMNVVHMRVKPGKEEEYVRLHREMNTRSYAIGQCWQLTRGIGHPILGLM